MAGRECLQDVDFWSIDMLRARLLRQPGAITIEWTSVPGLNNAPERRAADSGGAWSPATGLILGQPGGTTLFTDPVGTNRWPWLRVRCIPPGVPWL